MRFSILVSAAAIVGHVISSAVAAPTIYNYSGVTQAYVVPSGVTNLHVSLWGGGGGGKLAGQEGAAGAYLTGDLAVTPGQSFIISVGGGGTSSNFYGPSNGGFGGGGKGGPAGFGSVIFQGGAGGGGYSGIFLNSVSIANALTVAAGGGGGGATGAGSLPLLAPSATPTSLIGGNGGIGGDGGPGGAGTPAGSLGNGGVGGGGAGGGYDGGTAGSAGSVGSPGTPGTPGPGGKGGTGGNGANGGPAGSYFSLLTSFAGEVSSGSAAVGLADPNFSALNSGFGGLVFATGGGGRIVINPTAVPEPASITLLAVVGFACLCRHRLAGTRR